MLSSLKALANIGVKTETLNDLLMTIIEDDQLPLENRLAAVYTFRRFSCEEASPQFIELLRNHTMDSEIRIALYLQIMRCPNYHIIEVIRNCLENEEVNQGNLIVNKTIIIIFILISK